MYEGVTFQDIDDTVERSYAYSTIHNKFENKKT